MTSVMPVLRCAHQRRVAWALLAVALLLLFGSIFWFDSTQCQDCGRVVVESPKPPSPPPAPPPPPAKALSSPTAPVQPLISLPQEPSGAPDSLSPTSSSTPDQHVSSVGATEQRILASNPGRGFPTDLQCSVTTTPSRLAHQVAEGMVGVERNICCVPYPEGRDRALPRPVSPNVRLTSTTDPSGRMVGLQVTYSAPSGADHNARIVCPEGGGSAAQKETFFADSRDSCSDGYTATFFQDLSPFAGATCELTVIAGPRGNEAIMEFSQPRNCSSAYAPGCGPSSTMIDLQQAAESTVFLETGMDYIVHRFTMPDIGNGVSVQKEAEPLCAGRTNHPGRWVRREHCRGCRMNPELGNTAHGYLSNSRYIWETPGCRLRYYDRATVIAELKKRGLRKVLFFGDSLLRNLFNEFEPFIRGADRSTPDIRRHRPPLHVDNVSVHTADSWTIERERWELGLRPKPSDKECSNALGIRAVTPIQPGREYWAEAVRTFGQPDLLDFDTLFHELINCTATKEIVYRSFVATTDLHSKSGPRWISNSRIDMYSQVIRQRLRELPAPLAAKTSYFDMKQLHRTRQDRFVDDFHFYPSTQDHVSRGPAIVANEALVVFLNFLLNTR